jgi:hypothetical protein
MQPGAVGIDDGYFVTGLKRNPPVRAGKRREAGSGDCDSQQADDGQEEQELSRESTRNDSGHCSPTPFLEKRGHGCGTDPGWNMRWKPIKPASP